MSMTTWALGVLVLVMVAIPVVLHSLRRLPMAGANPRALELLGQMSLGPRERVVLVRAQDRVLVLGVTQHQVTLLNQLDNLPQADTAALPLPATAGFANLLRDTLSSYTGRRP